MWTHANCCGVSAAEYRRLGEQASESWYCPACMLSELPYFDTSISGCHAEANTTIIASEQWRIQGGCFGCSCTPLASALHIIITVHALNHTTIMPFSRAFLARCTASSNAAPSQTRAPGQLLVWRSHMHISIISPVHR